MKLDFLMSAIFSGFVMGKGYNLKELIQNGDKDVIAVLYNEFEEKIEELKVK